jgi:DNA-binding MarR family transcriptional regulator
MAAVTSVMRVQAIYQARVDAALKPFGLTFARYELLQLLSFTKTGALPLGKLGTRLQVHPASVTNAVDRLETDGLVRRRQHPDDKRSTLAEITPAGRRLVERATMALNREVFEDPGMGRGDAMALVALLTDTRRRAGDFE